MILCLKYIAGMFGRLGIRIECVEGSVSDYSYKTISLWNGWTFDYSIYVTFNEKTEKWNNLALKEEHSPF